ncbi:uncharacterized protein LOC134420569 isoform X3 [Melospiza melodia melodia]|uniref:uncharacterized protein LOC134420569 isoform X3 n=1 Tax=Melospiza melodia melodia TaxID=1914991 RepID=UPI002FD57BC6
MSGRGGHGGHRTPSEAEVTAAPPSPRRRQPRDAAGGTGGMRGRPELPPGPDPSPGASGRSRTPWLRLPRPHGPWIGIFSGFLPGFFGDGKGKN